MTEFESTVASILSDPLLQSVPVVNGKKVLPPVELHSRLGEGAMGAVYRGTHLELKIEVAVKCLKPALVAESDQFEARFRREANLAARLSHQNLVRLYELRSGFGLAYLVLEFVDGETVGDRVKRKGPLPEEDAAKILLAAARGLAVAHRHAEVIIHRDIKPANLLISKHGQVKVADLGLAKAMESSGNASIQTLGLVGTPKYMAPEQWEPGAELTPRTDVWALGATLYYLLTGQTAMQGNSISQIAFAVVNEEFPDARLLRPDLSAELFRLLERCTQRAPADRYPDALELAKDLQIYLRARSAEPIEPEEPLPFWRRGKNRAMAAGLLVLALLFAWGQSGGTGAQAHSGSRSYSLSGNGQLATEFTRYAPTDARVPLNWEVVDGTPGLDGWATVVREPKTRLEFRLIERGTFMMGSPESEKGRDPGERLHEVELTNSFYMALTEYAVMHGLRCKGIDPATRDGVDLPVTELDWEDSRSLCRVIGCDFPTEAQWEYAARAGKPTRYWWGDDPLGSNGRCNINAYPLKLNDGFSRTPSPVGTFLPDSRGFVDLTGNVMEWCLDGSDSYSGAPRVDPMISQSGDLRILRGGSWSSGANQSRLAARMTQSKYLKSDQVGFRPVLTLYE